MRVGEVSRQHAAQMRFAEDDDVIEALAAEGSDQSLHVWIGVSRRLRHVRMMRDKRFASRIPLIRYMGRVFRWVDCRQTWGEDRVYFYNDAGELARLPLRWTDVVPADPTAVLGAGRAYFRYDDLCRLADLLSRHD